MKEETIVKKMVALLQGQSIQKATHILRLVDEAIRKSKVETIYKKQKG